MPIGNRDQYVGRHDAHVGIGALRSEQIADAVADLDVGHAGANRLDHADGVGAEPVRQRQRITSGAEVNVDEVHGDVAVAHARLAGPRIADVDLFDAKHFGTADAIQTDGSCHV